jgi:hypothetical protein
MLNPSMFSIISTDQESGSWSFSRSLRIRFMAALNRNAEVDMLATLQRIDEQQDQHTDRVLRECTQAYGEWTARKQSMVCSGCTGGWCEGCSPF